MNNGKPTHQDDMARILKILGEAPEGGLSMEEIQKATSSGEVWSLRTINGLLCDLGSQVAHEKVRVRTGKVTKYWIKGI